MSSPIYNSNVLSIVCAKENQEGPGKVKTGKWSCYIKFKNDFGVVK